MAQIITTVNWLTLVIAWVVVEAVLLFLVVLLLVFFAGIFSPF
jgi:hypothetical protein